MQLGRVVSSPPIYYWVLRSDGVFLGSLAVEELGRGCDERGLNGNE